MQKIHCVAVMLDVTGSWCLEVVSAAGGQVNRTFMFDQLRNSRLVDQTQQIVLYPVCTLPGNPGERWGAVWNRVKYFDDDGPKTVSPAVIKSLPPGALYDFGEEDVPRGTSARSFFTRKIDEVRQSLLQ